jgi:hypothetical protein
VYVCIFECIEGGVKPVNPSVSTCKFFLCLYHGCVYVCFSVLKDV